MLPDESVFSPWIALLAILVVVTAASMLVLVELPVGEPIRLLIDGHAQKLMFAVAAVAMASSLYYSEHANFTPCDFCWYQRIAMYPLAVLLLVGLVTRLRLDSRFVVTLAGVGLALSIYHYQLQQFPDQGEICSATAVSCTAKYVEEYGFVTIPFMAGAGFLTVLLLQVAEWRVDYRYRRERR